ncbi:hypothetical protein FSARC_5203 [Fusarium sarcochroum]|uniref:Zn(2)-C6 fungal-type domain-containing protein n=1 Tax=Fusarium sarcochroum TaxID=1208366 RepID=A0A8H4U0C2_9HYPO|nr:hypothetical protein FSARC_5203 [Fusarium sarcochroum]
MDQDDDNALLRQESLSHSEEHHELEPEHEPKATEKLACDNCRQRKVKCDRVFPCSHCLKTKVYCTFPSGQKPRVKRQRIHISNVYLNHCTPNSHASVGPSQPPPFNTPPSSFEPTSSSYAATLADPVFAEDENRQDSSRQEYEGESSLFAHAVYATSFLQCAVNNNSSSQVALEMNSVLNALRNVVDAQKQQTDSLQNLYPNARPLAPGASLRTLPLPDTNKALACLRMAQENPQIQILWLMEFQTVAQFTTHFIKVCSPGPVTAADLIIVNAGLFWLFCECSNTTTDETLKGEYLQQASIARASLETILSRLPFHIPATLDYVYATSMACLYCLENYKPSAAWNFICSASQLSQAIGLHSNISLRAETPDNKRQKNQLFWSIYTTEKMLALRIGRSSTIRENDITIPRVGPGLSCNGIFSEMCPLWIASSSLQGRIYDEIYSPGSLSQPESVRTSRAKALAEESKTLMQVQSEMQRKHVEQPPPEFSPSLVELMWRAERVCGLSTLTLIYRSISPGKDSSSVFCDECIDSARDALREHEKCISLLADDELQSTHYDLYVNWVLLQMPFTPFIVVFCHMIETSDPTDIYYLENVVKSLQSTSSTSHHTVCQKQLSLFKALYDVAVKYFDVKKRAPSSNAGGSDSRVRGGLSDERNDGLRISDTRPNGVTVEMERAHATGSMGTEYFDQPYGDLVGSRGDGLAQPGSVLSEFSMEMDPPVAELATWFYTSQMMSMLDDA